MSRYEVCDIALLDILLFTMCLTGSLIQVGLVLQTYLQYDFAITVEEIPREGLQFPAITICVDAWMDVYRTCAYRPGKCSRSDLTFSLSQYYVQIDRDLRKFGAFPAKELFECTVHHPACRSFSCKDAMTASYFRVPSQLCYTVDITKNNKEQLNECQDHWFYDVLLTYRYNATRTYIFSRTSIFPVIVHAPYTAPPDRLSPISVIPGKSFEIGVQQQQIKRLKTPYKSQCMDYIALKPFEEFGGYMNLDICIQNCSMALEYEHCKCIRSVHEYSGSQHRALCGFKESDACLKIMETNSTYDQCLDRCRLPCNEIRYDVRLLGISDIKAKSKEDVSRSFQVRAVFRSDLVEHTLYHPLQTRVEVNGRIGSYTGIWLGFSILQVLLGLNDRFQKRKHKYFGRIRRGLQWLIEEISDEEDDEMERSVSEREMPDAQALPLKVESHHNNTQDIAATEMFFFAQPKRRF